MKRLFVLFIAMLFFCQMLAGVCEAEKSFDADPQEVEYELLSRGSKGEAVVALQNRLNELGYDVGKPDGDFGRKTQKAVEAFQKKNQIEVTGEADVRTQEVLFSDSAIASDDEAHEANAEMDNDEVFSELTEFKSVMMESISEQISRATDLTASSENRAILAALLSLEFGNQVKDFQIDTKLPIFVCKQGDIAAVALGGEEDYALVIYQSKPLSTSYGILRGNDPAIVKATLDLVNEEVWKVDMNLYEQALEAVIAQL